MDCNCKCVICGEIYEPSPVHGSRREKIGVEKDETLLHKQLSIILLLRKVLQLRQSHLEALLQECGNPETWGISMCPPCNRVFLEAEFVHERLQQLHNEFDNLCKRLRTQLRASVENASNSNSSESDPRRKTRRGCKTGGDRRNDINLETKRGNADELNFEVLESIRTEFLSQRDESTSQANNSSIIRRANARINSADGYTGSRCARKESSLTGDDEDEWSDKAEDVHMKHGSSRGKKKRHRSVRKIVKFSKDIDEIEDRKDEMCNSEPNSPAVSDTMEDSALSPEWTPEDADYDSADDRKKESTKPAALSSSLATSTDTYNREEPDKDLPAVPPKSTKCSDGFFKCPLCDKKNPTRRSSDAHIRKSHYGERLPYHCDLCPKQTVNESRMENHLIDVHKISDPLVEDDVDSDDNNDSIVDNQKTEEPPVNEYEDLTKPFRCEICPPRKARFRTARSLAAHNKQVHMGIDKPYECEHCEKAFARFSGWKDHQRFHERQSRKPKKEAKKRYCGQCDKYFGSWNAVKFHFLSKAHTDQKRFLCDLCTKLFNSQTALDSHRGSEHFSELGLTPFQCRYCKKILGTKRNLDNHVRCVHTKETKYQCPHCERGFMFSGTLTNHINAVHEKAKLFQCSYCPNSYPLRQYLNMHMRMHTGEKPYACKTCGKKFADKPTYNRHVEAHTNTVHECPVENCKKRYKTRHAFRIHMKSHDKTGMKYKEYLKSLQSARQAATDNETPSEPQHSQIEYANDNLAVAAANCDPPSLSVMKTTTLTDKVHDIPINISSHSQCIPKQELEPPQPGTSNLSSNPNAVDDNNVMPHLLSQAFYQI